jgi:DNA-binding transcriptional LysR family regulator
MDDMNWNAIKLFLVVREKADLQQAARTLGLSHSTVFRQLKTLEQDIGARLFERVGGRYGLTEAGEALLLHAQAIAGSFDEISREVAGRDQKLSGVVRLTAPTSFSYTFLPEYLASFRQEHPEVQVELLVSNEEANLSHRQADIAVRVATAPPDHLVGRLVRSIKWGVYASTDATHVPRELDELVQFKLLGPAGKLRTHRAFEWVERHLATQIGSRCDDFVAMARCAEAGLGLAVMPDDLQSPGLQRLFTFAPAGENSLWMLTHPDLRQVQRIKALMSHLAEAFRADSRLVS